MMFGCSDIEGPRALFFVVGLSQRRRPDICALSQHSAANWAQVSLKPAAISSTVSSTLKNLQTATAHTTARSTWTYLRSSLLINWNFEW
jgi:hypothetical protein